MTIICSKCGSSLAADVSFCPQCGTPTSSYYSESGASPYEPTALKPPSQIPSTEYGSNPYGVPLQNPYEPFNPYAVPAPPPPPKRQRKSSMLIGILSGIIVTVLILASVGAFVLLTKGAKNTPSGNTSLPTVTTASTQMTATAAAGNPYTHNGTLILSDPLNDNSKGYGWSEYTSTKYSTSCQFTGGAYAASTPLYVANFCYATATNFSNFAFEMQMKIIKGDCGAILFRANSANQSFYYFVICQNGLYAVGAFNGSAWHDLINFQPSSAINQGLGQTNLVAVVARGNSLDLYVNHQKINSISDGTYRQGQIGACASGHDGDPTEVQFSNAKVWTL